MSLRRVLLICVCLLFAAGGAVNQGFSAFVFALPFIRLLYSALPGRAIHRMAMAAGTTAIMVAISLTAETNRIIYPHIGETFQASCGWDVITDKYAPQSIKAIVHQGKYVDADFILDRHPLPCSTSWTLRRVTLSHPDFGTTYDPVFAVEGQEFVMHDSDLTAALEAGDISRPGLSSAEQLQSTWTARLGMLMMWPMLPIMLLAMLPH